MPLFKTFPRWALVGLAIFACREQITAPAECPELCPGGYEIRDTILDPVAGQDSSYEGYVLPGDGTSLEMPSDSQRRSLPSSLVPLLSTPFPLPPSPFPPFLLLTFYTAVPILRIDCR